MNNKNQLFDSLETKGFQFSKIIDYFALDSINEIKPNKNAYCFGKRLVNDSIEILKIKNSRIIQKRLLKKYIDGFYIEEQIWDNSDGAEINYFTIYYSREKIVVIETTKMIFENQDKNIVLSGLFIIKPNTIVEYNYPYNNNLHLNSPFYYLTSNQLKDIEQDAISYFIDKTKVEKRDYFNINFGKNESHIWQLFILD